MILEFTTDRWLLLNGDFPIVNS